MSDIAPHIDHPAETDSGPLVVRWIGLLPGMALLLGIGLAGRWCERALLAWGKSHHTPVPDIEYVLWAIVIGLVIANTVGVPRIFRAGVATYEFWLKAGIVLLGVRFLLGDVARLGGGSLLVLAVSFAVSVAVMTALGRRFGLGGKLTSLLAIGSAVCGVSAIIAAKGAIRARDEDASLAIAVILLLGAVSLFAFPGIGHAIGMTDHAYGLWVGLAVDNTAEATAAGAIWSDEAARYAVLAKTTRNATIGFIVLAYALYWASRGQAEAVTGRAAFLWTKFPKFVLGFLLVSLLATLGLFTKEQSASIAAASRWAFLLCFAGVGLATDLRKIGVLGARPLVVGVAGSIGISVVTFALVAGAQAAGWLG